MRLQNISASYPRGPGADNAEAERVDEAGVLSEGGRGLISRLNKVSRNDREARYDICDRSPDHGEMGRGVTLCTEEL